MLLKYIILLVVYEVWSIKYKVNVLLCAHAAMIVFGFGQSYQM